MVVEGPGTLVVVSAVDRGPPGPQGPPGPGGTSLEAIAEVTISGHRVVRALAGGVVRVASSSSVGDAAALLGVTTGAALAGAPVTVATGGTLSEPTWNWTPGASLFVGDAGELRESIPPGAAWIGVIAVALSTTEILINPSPVIHL